MTDLNLADWMERRRGSLDAHADYIIASVREYEAALSTRAPDPRVQALVDALVSIDALDPEAMIDACSSHAIRGLVLRMGETARATLKQWEDGE